jgi:hypothetical protein
VGLMTTVTVYVATVTHDATPTEGELQTVTYDLRAPIGTVVAPPEPPPPDPGPPGVLPTNPTELKAAYNALPGATMQNAYQRGINQTIAAAKCTQWRDAVTNAVGSAWVPSPETPAGAARGRRRRHVGCRCGARTAGELHGYALRARDERHEYESRQPDSRRAGRGERGAKRYTIFLRATRTGSLSAAWCGNSATRKTLSLESGGVDDTYFTPDYYSLWAPLADPLYGAATAVNTYGTGGPRTRIGWWLVDTPGNSRGNSWNFQQFGRDLLNRHKTLNPHPLTNVTGRRLRMGVNGGFPIAQGGEYNFLYIALGRESKAQNQLINDYLKSLWPDFYEDPRADLAVLLGNSYHEGIDAPIPGGFDPLDVGQAHDMQMGHTGRGLPRLPNCAFYAMAYSGDTIANAQFPLCRLLADMDYRPRGRIVILVGEILNGSNPAQNYYTADFARTIDPKVHTVLYVITFSDAGSKAANFPVYDDDFQANYAAHADGVVNLIRGPNSGLDFQYQPRNFGDGSLSPYPVGENEQVWSVKHPGVLMYQNEIPLLQGAVDIGLANGLAATRCRRLKPSVYGIDLSAGAPVSAAVSCTQYNALDNVISGHALTFDIVKLDGTVNAGFSSGTAIATVSSGGVVTRVAAGHVMLRIHSDDGATTFVDVLCS